MTPTHPILARIVKTAIDAPLGLVPRAQRIRVLRHLLDRARGDNNDVPEANGEYRVLAEARPELVKRGVAAFDVGANLGDWTVQLCEGLAEPLQVYAFEPSTETFGRLSARLGSLRTGASIHPVNAAMGRAPGNASLKLYGSLAGSNSLVMRGELTNGKGPAEETVCVVSGDTFCAERGIDEIGLVKVDTEGFELEVLRGLEGMLRRGAVGAVEFEYGGTWIDARILLRDAFDLLRPLGYTLAKIHPEGIEILPRYDTQLESFQYANYLALRSDWLSVFTHID